MQSGDGICLLVHRSSRLLMLYYFHLKTSTAHHCCLFFLVLFACLLAFNFILQGGLGGAGECLFIFNGKVHCYLETTTNSQGREPRVTSLQRVPGISEQVLISYQNGLGWKRNTGWRCSECRGGTSRSFYLMPLKFI